MNFVQPIGPEPVHLKFGRGTPVYEEIYERWDQERIDTAERHRREIETTIRQTKMLCEFIFMKWIMIVFLIIVLVDLAMAIARSG